MPWRGRRDDAAGRRGRSLAIVLLLLAVFLLTAIADPALAQSLTVEMGAPGEGSFTGRLVQVLGLVTVLSIAPGLLVMVTSFTRIVVVLALLRSALGLQQTPPNMVLIGLALFLTAYIMGPTFDLAWRDGVQPLVDGTVTEAQAFERILDPFRAFMLENTRPKDLALFLEMEGGQPATATVLPTSVPLGPQGILLAPDPAANGPAFRPLVAAFIISELRRAFEIGFLLFLPFLVIDMIVAAVLMAMGMMMLPPVVISLPFKIIFFVLIDGWFLLAGSLVRSYGGIA